MKRPLLVVLVVLVVAVIVGVVILAGGSESDQEQLVDKLESDFDMGPEQAECVADQLFERFSTKEIDALREVESRDDLSEQQLADLRAALTPCASAGS